MDGDERAAGLIVIEEPVRKEDSAMNTFWLKAAGIAVVGLILLVVGAQFFGGDRETSPTESDWVGMETKSFTRQVEEDRERLGAEPKPIDPPVKEEPPQPVPDPGTRAQPAELADSSEPTVIYVKPLQDFEELAAQRLWNTAMPGRSIGRLPMTGYNLAVKGCSEIIQRWPDSKYAFMAMRLLNDIPANRRGQARDLDIDMSRFYQKQPGTQPMAVEDTDRR